MHSPEGAYTLAETKLATRIGGDLPIGMAEAPEVRRLRHHYPRHDIGRRGVADCIFAYREWLEQLRVRLLVGFRDHADTPDHAFLIDLAGRAVLSCPVRHGPACDALVVRVRHLVVFP